MRKKGNIYFVNTVNIENTVNTAKKNKNKNKKTNTFNFTNGSFIVGRIHTINRF